LYEEKQNKPITRFIRNIKIIFNTSLITVNISLFINSDVDQIESGIGDQLALFFQYVSAFFAGFIIGFIYGWKLTLVILAVSPLLAVAGGLMARVITNICSLKL